MGPRRDRAGAGREATHDAVTRATKDHVDAWYVEDGEAYERMAAHRVQGGRAIS